MAKKETLTLTIDSELKEHLVEMADSIGISVSAFCALLIREAILNRGFHVTFPESAVAGFSGRTVGGIVILDDHQDPSPERE